MNASQQRYIANLKQIKQLSDLFKQAASFEEWYELVKTDLAQCRILKEENNAFLKHELFPFLDDIYAADDRDIEELSSFADQLILDNDPLDAGLYILINEALLSLYRTRRDRDGIIKELYKNGMGLFYQNQMLQSLSKTRRQPFAFANELYFTEGGSYIRYFDKIESQDTKGYVIRSLANVSIATTDSRKKVRTTSRILKILKDDYYRSLAPDLPWERYLRASYQQMSATRSTLSRGTLSNEELSEIMEACQIVFEPETGVKDPNIRWLWPYYEMEYTCGFVDIKTTLSRMEELIGRYPYDQHDESALYGNVQLPSYYGTLLKNNPGLLKDHHYVDFLDKAYRKALLSLNSVPVEKRNRYFRYLLDLFMTEYFETDGVEPYLDVLIRLMSRFGGQFFIRSLYAADIMALLASAICKDDPNHFIDIPTIKMAPEGQKTAATIDYAYLCGLLYDTGSFILDLPALENRRDLFEQEQAIYELHAAAGSDHLKTRPSTERFADIALGHHRHYSGGGYPEEYERISSDYRMMCDVMALVAYIVDNYAGDLSEVVSRAAGEDSDRFSPFVLSYLDDHELLKQMETILSDNERSYYSQIYNQ